MVDTLIVLIAFKIKLFDLSLSAIFLSIDYIVM